jgi:hypothetical protein
MDITSPVLRIAKQTVAKDRHDILLVNLKKN